MRKDVAAAIATGAVLAGGLIGGRYGPQPNHPRTTAWYARLRKPGFTPPGPVFGAAWAVLDGLLAFTGYRILKAAPGPERNLAVASWGVSVAGLAAHPFLFFGRRSTAGGLAVTGTMAASSAATVAASAHVDGPAALAGVPLVLWTVFATLLNEEIWRRN